MVESGEGNSCGVEGGGLGGGRGSVGTDVIHGSLAQGGLAV